ncbi:hypothetical protein RRG08_002542 [Elysia crispata]|uniref:Uncharacterized protein n=1 Tax=Elysia crispata TaxID=231223 RepID=A0AAE0Y505_9GAST|nr:hypothetical protein RRG08_002542 [Elysia crispata]
MFHSQSQDDLILREQMNQQQQQMEALLALVHQSNPPISNTKLGEFEPSTKLWSDYWARFETSTKANSISDDRRAEIFLTNQCSMVNKLFKSGTTADATQIRYMSMDEIATNVAE